MIWYAVLCDTELYCPILYYTTLHYTVPYSTMPYSTLLCYGMVSYSMIFYDMTDYALYMICDAIGENVHINAMLYYATLYCAMLCYKMLYN